MTDARRVTFRVEVLCTAPGCECFAHGRWRSVYASANEELAEISALWQTRRCTGNTSARIVEVPRTPVPRDLPRKTPEALRRSDSKSQSTE